MMNISINMLQCKRTIQLFTIGTTFIVLSFVAVSANATGKRSYKILEGDNLLVVCNVSDTIDTRVYWTKNDTKQSFKISGKRLEIFDIKRSFSGVYICHALNTSYPVPEYNETESNQTVEIINVDVQYPGEVDQFYAGPSVLLENDTFNITCDFRGNPAPTWLIGKEGGEDLLTMNLSAVASLTSSASCWDTGVWQCTGYNSLNHGVNATRKQHVTVHCSPRPQYKGNEYIVDGKIGQPATFIMNLWSSPRPNYTWTKDDGTDISGFTRQYDYPNTTMLTFDMVSIPAFEDGKPAPLKLPGIWGSLTSRTTVSLCTGLPISTWVQNNTFVFLDFMRMVIRRQVGHYIYDTSANHGINIKWTYVLTGLASGTFYNLTVVSENESGRMSGFARPVYFWTSERPSDGSDEWHINITLIVGLVCGLLGFVGFAAFLVYIFKYRRLRTSYVEISEKPRKL